MAYEVALETYAGPLDLLLHLIRKHEIDIHDIPIARITEQFLAHLRAMEELSMEIASEFLVMAATLLAIKSRMLLPKKSPDVTDGEEEGDPREQLVQQLIAYQQCKLTASELKSREQAQSQVFTRPPVDLRPYQPDEPQPLEGVSLWAMVDAFRQLMLRLPKEDQVAEIRGHIVSVDDRMEHIVARLRRWPRTTLTQLMQGYVSRGELVTTFLAVLELVKRGLVSCTQSAPFADIEIVLREVSVG